MAARIAEPVCRKSGDPDVLELLRNRRVYIETYGCRYNFGDTAKLVEVLKHQGNTLVDTPDHADAVIINTCTVVGSTERRMLRRLSHFGDRDLYVTGCMQAVQRDAIFAVCTPHVISPETVRDAYRSVLTVAGGGVGIIQIAQGCVGRCTYCITRAARGPLKSFTKEEIRAQVQAQVNAGTYEIQVTAQDVSAWGLDTGRALPELVTSIGNLPGRYMIRVGMMNPATVRGILDELLDAFASDHVYKFIHIPVQSGSDRVLDRMGRGYTAADFEEIIAAFRKRYPGITVATDIIVGFSGETDEDFFRSLEIIDRVRPNKVNVTRYSRRPFTALYSEKDAPDSIKKDRSRIMNSRAEQVYGSINSRYIGTVMPFIVTETIRKGSVMARSPDYLGIVIQEDLPPGFEGRAILRQDRKYFFIGERLP
jgi:MiaB-like tRNA modifying enzyme